MFQNLLKDHEIEYALGTVGLADRRGGKEKTIVYDSKHLGHHRFCHRVFADEDNYLNIVDTKGKGSSSVVFKQML